MTRPAVAGLNHVTLAVADLDRSLAFYVELLGCQLRARWDAGAYLHAGELWLCLSRDAPRPRTDYTHIAFTIEAADAGAWRERLDAAGIRPWKENSSEGASLYCLDPDGHRLELHAGDLGTRLQALQEAPYPGTCLIPTEDAPFARASDGDVRLLLVAGSVRGASVNRAFVRAITAQLPAGVSADAFDDFDRLPMFSPDRDRADLTALTASGAGERTLTGWLNASRAADIVLFACPEYAGGLPGAFKNGLDHLVGSDAFIDKRYVLVNLAPRAHHAQAQLDHVLTTMSGQAIRGAFLTLDVGGEASAVAVRLSDHRPSLLAAFTLMIDAVRGRVDAST